LVVSWNMSLNKTFAQIASYQIYAYQEVPNQTPHVDLWNRVGEVNALPLPMACSLTQVNIKNIKNFFFFRMILYFMFIFIFL
jgi:hypothetical protein